MNPQTLETARKRLELILNSEIVEANEGYDFIVEKYIQLAVNNFTILTNGEPSEETKKILKDFNGLKLKTEKKLRENIADTKRSQIQGENRMILRTSEPYFIARGSHQAVIDIGDGLIAKLKYEKRFSSDKYLSVSFDYPFLKDTIDSLRSIGLFVPELEFLRASWNNDKIEVSSEVSHESYRKYLVQKQRFLKRTKGKPVYHVDISMPTNLPNICITSDLRESGKYQVFDFEEEIAKRLSNSNEVIKEYEKHFSRLIGIYNKKRIYLKPDDEPFIEYEPHFNNTPEEAIKKMFLLQVPTDRRDLGKLVIGDLDHIKVFW